MEDELMTSCLRLREFLKQNKDEIVSEGYLIFGDFPTGCCEKTTHLLAHYLIYRGLCNAAEMRMPWNNYDKDGEWGCSSHGWILLSSGLNIDITADQFAGIEETAIVARDHDFHKRFIGGEWVSFEEHHRRVTWQDDGESFRKVWRFVKANI
jgi:hypothetical protein